MVAFNPELPDVNPRDWTNVSRPISQPEADKSKALTIAATADTLDSGVRLAESLDQDVIKEKTRAGVEALRDATTLAYENVRGSLLTGQPVNTQAANVAGLPSLRVAQANSVPESLQAGLDRASDLATARTQGTLRANDTLYTGALNALAKQLRAEYPGHKDFIDEQISRISGKNPANAYMDNLLSDISHLTTGQDSFEKKVVSKAFENMGDQSTYIALRKYQATRTPEALSALADSVQQVEAEKWRHTQFTNENSEADAAGKQDVNQARAQTQKVAQDIFFRQFNDVIKAQGLSPQLITQLINEQQSGKITSIPPGSWESMAQQMEQVLRTSQQQVKERLNATGLSSRLARYGNVGDEKAIVDNEAQTLKDVIASIRDPNKGLFFEYARRSKAMQDTTNYQTDTSDVGEMTRRLKVISERAGPQWTTLASQWNLGKMLGPMQNFFNDKTMAIGSPDDPRLGTNAKSLTADIVEAKKRNQALAAQNRQQVPQVYDNLVKNIDLLDRAVSDPSLHENAKEIVKYMFDPSRNADFVKQWSRDFTDNNNVTHKGYFAYYDYLSSPRVVDNIRKLNDPETWNMFRNWSEHNFRQLFGNEIQTLNNKPGNVHFTIEWNDRTHQMTPSFERVDPQYRTKNDVDTERFISEDISKLNQGLKNLGYMYSRENTEPNEGIFTTLMQLNYKPDDRLHGSSLPKKVIDAINMSQFQPTPEERLKGSFERMQKPRGD